MVVVVLMDIVLVEVIVSVNNDPTNLKDAIVAYRKELAAQALAFLFENRNASTRKIVEYLNCTTNDACVVLESLVITKMATYIDHMWNLSDTTRQELVA